MAGVNKVILVGRLGKDPETRYLPSGAAVTKFSIATSDVRRDKQSGEKIEQTEWHNIVTFERLAEIAAEYLRKGSQVYIEGRIRTDKWKDKEGRDRYTTEIIAGQLQLLGSRSDSMAGGHGTDSRAEPRSTASGGGGERGVSAPMAQDEGFDDEIPF